MLFNKNRQNQTIEQNDWRQYFQMMLEKLLFTVKFNITEREKSLNGKDIKLLKKADASLIYLMSLYDNDWRVSLPNLVQRYAEKIAELMGQKYDSKCPDDYLSLVDVAIIVEHTDDVIHYLITEYDPGAYYQKRSMISRIMTFMNSAKSVTDSRRQLAAPPSALPDTQ